MSESAERVRFCNSCNGVVGWYATHCDSCGRSLRAPAEKQTSDAVPEQAVVHHSELDLYKAQMRLIRNSHKRAQALERTIDAEATRIERLLAGARGNEARRALVGASERVMSLEQEWEDIQKAHNLQSEGIEEEFLSRIQELESDLELSPDRQDALEKKAKTFLGTLDGLQERLAALGRTLDLALVRQTSRFLGIPTSGRAGAIGMSLIVLSGLGLGAFLGWREGAGPDLLVQVLVPPAVAIAIVGFAWRRRERF